MTERGLTQVWLVESDGIRTTTSATGLRIKDRGRMFDEVRRDLLSGAQLVSDANR
ncbi:hypothetical protein JW805_09865 [Roseomonas aeriglobus]|nr:hypothetical protein [Roseomonas aeriglobus]